MRTDSGGESTVKEAVTIPQTVPTPVEITAVTATSGAETEVQTETGTFEETR